MVTINQLAEIVADIADQDNHKAYPWTPGVRGRNSITPACAKCLWEPQLTLEEALKRTYTWIEKQVAQNWAWNRIKDGFFDGFYGSQARSPNPHIISSSGTPIHSWMRLKDVEVILIGDEAGILKLPGNLASGMCRRWSAMRRASRGSMR